MRVPPKPVRRLLFGPAVVVLAVVMVTTAPLVLLLVGVAALIPRIGRITRVVAFIAFYIVWEAIALVCLFGLWIASGFGYAIRSESFRNGHYRLAGWLLRIIERQLRWSMRLRIIVGDETEEATISDAPVILASRHAGPGDSLVLVHLLLNHYHRRPRIILKDTLQWDPMIDVMLNRLEMVFITPTPFYPSRSAPRGPRPIERISKMAEKMGPRDALVLFPEGGNFTLGRRAARIQQLRDRGGADSLALRAAAMPNVMAPRPGGVFAAADACPEAGILFVGHTGLEKLSSVRALWRALPVRKTIALKSWYVASEDIPEEWTSRVSFLYDAWATLDDWVGETDVAALDT